MSLTRASPSARGRRSTSAAWRSSRRASRTSATSAGSSTCRWRRARSSGTRCGRRAGARHRARRHRRVRHDRPAREGVPRVRRRARRGLHRRRGRHGVVEGEGPGLRRQGGVRRAPRGGAGREALHADDRRPHLDERREALPARARADHDARRRADRRRARPPLVRDERRRGPVARQAHPDDLPAAGARGRGDEARGRVHERAVSRDRRRSSARRRRSTRRTRGSAREDSRLREARADHGREDGADRRRAGARDAAPRLHDQPARGVRGGGGRAARRGERRRDRRADARPARGGGAAARLHGDRRRPRHPAEDRRRRVGRAVDGAAIVDAIRGDGAVRPDPLRQRVGGHGQLPGRDPRRARARAAGRERPEEDRAAGRHASAASATPAVRATSTSCRCPRCSRRSRD